MENLGFDSWHGQEIFLFSKIPTQALGSTQSPNKWVPFSRSEAAGMWS